MTLAGIDVSAAGQGPNFPWPQYKNKIGFAGVKISQAVSYADPDAARNVAQAHALGIPVIGYHFLIADLSGSAQAEWFLKCAALAKLKPGLDHLAIDAEDGGLNGESYAQMDLAGAAQSGQSFTIYAYGQQTTTPTLSSSAANQGGPVTMTVQAV